MAAVSCCAVMSMACSSEHPGGLSDSGVSTGGTTRGVTGGATSSGGATASGGASSSAGATSTATTGGTNSGGAPAGGTANGGAAGGGAPPGGGGATGTSDAGSDGGNDAGADPDAGPPAPSIYDDPGKWTCRPGMPDNPCDQSVSITDVHADGTTTVSEMPRTPADVGADCFYLYPTIDSGLFAPPRNLDFDQIDKATVREIFFTQALAFRRICAMWAPIYRQASLVSFLNADSRKTGLETAYKDVEAAFDYYLAHAGKKRPILFVTHSQGSIVTTFLLQRRFEGHPDLMKRLVVAMLAGPLGGFAVPAGKVVGGTLHEIPLCTSASQTGCALTWDTFSSTNPPGSGYLGQNGGLFPGSDVGCTAPPGGIGAPVRLGGALFYTMAGNLAALAPQYNYGSVKVSTPFARYADFYTALCSKTSSGASYLALTASPLEGDVRVDPVPYNNIALSDSSDGLHLLDYTFYSDDLIVAAKAKIAAFGK